MSNKQLATTSSLNFSHIDRSRYFRHCGFKVVPLEGEIERRQEVEDVAAAHAVAADMFDKFGLVHGCARHQA